MQCKSTSRLLFCCAALPSILASEPIPAGDVLHLYRKRRPSQLRDVSWLAPVLLRLRDLGDYETALLMKAKIEACLAAVVTDDTDTALDPTSHSASTAFLRFGEYRLARLC